MIRETLLLLLRALDTYFDQAASELRMNQRSAGRELFRSRQIGGRERDIRELLLSNRDKRQRAEAKSCFDMSFSRHVR
jgi:hypothetical protein